MLYDGVCGTSGMMTVAEETLQQLAQEHGKEVATHLYGQEINAETYAICKAALPLKGSGPRRTTSSAVRSAQHLPATPFLRASSTSCFPIRHMIVCTPTVKMGSVGDKAHRQTNGKSWKTDLERMRGKRGPKDPRFLIEHAGDPEYSFVTRPGDGPMPFWANMLSKLKRGTKLGSRISIGCRTS